MSKIKLKVCGMKYSENIKEIAGFGPDYMGFIFYGGSPRYVGKDFSTEDFSYLPTTIKKVGVFVNEEIKTIIDTAKKHDLEYVQLHGSESPQYCKQIRDMDIGVIKSISVGSSADIRSSEKYKGSVDFLLFDTSGSNYGGNGKKFDWDLLNHYQMDIPFLLSGGIGPEDLSEAHLLNHAQLHAIDINSRFEIEPGLKDEQLVGKAIIKLKEINE